MSEIEEVRLGWVGWFVGMRRGGGRADIFQHLDFGADAFEVLVVLVFELGEDGVAVLAPVDTEQRNLYQRLSFLPLPVFTEAPLFLPLPFKRSSIPTSLPPCSPSSIRAPLLFSPFHAPMQIPIHPPIHSFTYIYTYLEFGVALLNPPLTCPIIIPLPPPGAPTPLLLVDPA